MEQRPTRTSGSWLARRIRSFQCALRGLAGLVATQPNARIHLAATVGVVTLGLALHIERWEWCAVLAAIGLVWAAEGLNSALETLADHVAPEQHPRIGRAKDLAAGAVLAASLAAAGIGLLVFGPRLF
jgi:diacylglycerol kinase (ATP)